MDPFERKVQAAAIAAWWVVLTIAIFVTALWIVYLVVLPLQPEWLISVWGPGSSWDLVRSVFFWGVVGLKLFDWFVAWSALWLTLWARQLRKQARRA